MENSTNEKLKQPELKWPKIAQIEVTSHCNFNCKMCVQHTWDEKPLHMPLELFEKIAQELFPYLDKVILYGLGEPLTHPGFIRILEITRKYLTSEGKIDFTTNGSLITPEMADKIVEFDINRIIVSVDTANISKLQKIREGASVMVMDHLKYLATLRHAQKFKELGVETVVMRSNYHDLLDLVEYCAQTGIDTIFGSHLLPHSEDMLSEVLHFTLSEEAWKYSSEICEKGWAFVSNLLFNPNEFRIDPDLPILQDLQKVVENGRNDGIQFNSPLIYDTFRRMSLLDEVKRVFMLAESLAKEAGVRLDLPRIMPRKDERECPFVKFKAVMILASGSVVPCYNYSHKQVVHAFGSAIAQEQISYGNVTNSSFQSAWTNPDYLDMRKTLCDFPKNVEYCGDCIYSTQNCHFITSNESDCLGLQPGCHTCLYCVDLVRCLFD